MALYTKQSLEKLRQRIDLVEVLSSYMDLKRVGAHFQALCPFHEEKSASFKLQRGDDYYHCYGCGAHGDAIQFLMESVKMGFTDAVEFLGERFHVVLEKENGDSENRGTSKTLLKEVMHHAKLVYHAYLLYTEEGHIALQYLYQRGIDLDFILHFQLGYVPRGVDMTIKPLLSKGIKSSLIGEVGLINKGGTHPFFGDRILFPILDPMGSVVAFSGRKYKESTFGGKYINSPETLLFKKSNLLFGIHYSRRRIAKEKKVLLVEGQIDALRLIQAGLDYSVAPLGTAFGTTHIKQLQNLGVEVVYLALDGDSAGRDAAVKMGDKLQSQGIEVYVVPMPQGLDPDTYIRQEGIGAFESLLEKKEEFLPFMVEVLSEGKDMTTPAGKNLLISLLRERLQKWESPVMVHESLKKLAFMLQVPQEMLGIGVVRKNYQKESREAVGVVDVNYDRILEGDLIRWLIIFNTEFKEELPLLFKVIKQSDFKVKEASKLYISLKEAFGKKETVDMLSLASYVEEGTRLFVDEIFSRKVAVERGDLLWKESLQKILDRNWMDKREEIRSKIQSGQYSGDEVLELAKEFDILKKNRTSVKERIKSVS